MKRINMAIIGAGNIAGHMAEAMNGLQEQVCAYGVASRSPGQGLDRAGRGEEGLFDGGHMDPVYARQGDCGHAE